MAARACLYDVEEDDEFDADFDENNESSEEEDEDSEEEDSDSGEDDDEGDHAILTGTIYLSDEGRVVFSGTWCTRSELDREDKEATAASASVLASSSPISKRTGRRRHPKFKLRSQEIYRGDEKECLSSKGDSNNKKRSGRKTALFDPRRPTLSSESPRQDGEAVLPPRRTMVFDGFFFEASDENSPQDGVATKENKHHHRHSNGKKIRERDVEVFFSVVEDDEEGGNGTNSGDETNQSGSVKDGKTPAFLIAGRGYNDFGPFILEGNYEPPLATLPPPAGGDSTSANGGNGEKMPPPPTAAVVCRKRYGMGGHAKKRTRASDAPSLSSPSQRQKQGNTRGSVRPHRLRDDEGVDDLGEGADFSELVELTEEAGLSIEELRRRYYGEGESKGGAASMMGNGKSGVDDDDDGGGKLPAKKKPRVEESDDDECGF